MEAAEDHFRGMGVLVALRPPFGEDQLYELLNLSTLLGPDHHADEPTYASPLSEDVRNTLLCAQHSSLQGT